MEWTSKVVSDFLCDKRNRVAFIILAALFLPLLLMSFIAEINYQLGYDGYHVLCCRQDRFGDLLKAAMSYKYIMANLVPDQSAQWSQLDRHYLTVQPEYHGLPITHYSMLPLGALLQMAAAELVVLFDPTTALRLFILFYTSCAVALSTMLHRFFHGAAMDRVMTALALISSYPVLFMVFRGNFSAGFTTLALAAYVLTVMKGQYRWGGLIALAMAMNLRPNTACFGLLELVIASNPRDRILKVLGTACLTLVIGGVACLIVQAGDPDYSLDNFLKAYSIYDIAYVRGEYGLEWNFSLYGTTRIVREMFGWLPAYDSGCYFVVSFLGTMSVVAAIALALAGRLTLVTATFLATSLSALFAPVFAFYHIMEYIVPLLAVFAAKGRNPSIDRENGFVFISCLLFLSPIDAERSLYPVLMAGAMFMVMLRAYQLSPTQIGLICPEPNTR